MNKSELPLYLLLVSYEREDKANEVIQDYLRASKPINTNFIIIENSAKPNLTKHFDFSEYKDVKYYYHPNRNKAALINYALKEIIKTDEAFIICIDNDIRFKQDYLINFFRAAQKYGGDYFFGSSFYVNIPNNVSPIIFPFLQGSAKGKPDKEFLQMKKLMFMGCSYAWFKSQWIKVSGLDERFSAGSKFNLAGEESVFQKKLVKAGYKPKFVPNNYVEHCPLNENFLFKNVLKRQENNGYTHGFQDLILSDEILKNSYFKNLIFLLSRLFVLSFKGDKIQLKIKFSHAFGYFKAFFLYIRIKNKKSFLDF